MNQGFKFSYWLMKVVGLLLLVAPIFMTLLPMGWENVTLGVVLHGVMDYINQWYHQAA